MFQGGECVHKQVSPVELLQSPVTPACFLDMEGFSHTGGGRQEAQLGHAAGTGPRGMKVVVFIGQRMGWDMCVRRE